MLILGIDPGSQITGFAVVEKTDHIDVIDFGHIKTKSKDSFGKKLEHIYTGIKQLLKMHPIDAISIETQFVKINPKAALNLGMVRGIVILAAAESDVEIFQYAPKSIKASVCHGSATKQQMQKMMQLLFKLDTIPEPEDAADALALAYHHAKMTSVLTL